MLIVDLRRTRVNNFVEEEPCGVHELGIVLSRLLPLFFSIYKIHQELMLKTKQGTPYHRLQMRMCIKKGQSWGRAIFLLDRGLYH
jgi:hypothetical protein